ncbi:MAG: ABC transporter permease [Solirubrobacteraceae bacterium]
MSGAVEGGTAEVGGGGANGALDKIGTLLFRALLVAALALALCFLTIPVAAVLVDSGPRDLLNGLADPGALDALRLSLETTAIAVAIIVAVGTPSAYLLATRRFPGRSVVVTLVELPLVLPPAVAGIALLASLGPNGILGGFVEDAGITLVLERAGVVVALTFVAAPFYLRQAQAAFAAVDPTLLEASRTLGAGEAETFARVAVRVARPGMLAGLALAWGRALGEFGATLVFAGSFRGVTQTAPLAIYERFGTDFTGALALSAVLVAVSAALLLGVKALGGADERATGGWGGPLGGGGARHEAGLRARMRQQRTRDAAP